MPACPEIRKERLGVFDVHLLRYPDSLMYKEQKITVVIPCLNEEQGVEKVLQRMPGFVDQVIVVDNGSPHRTSHMRARGRTQVKTGLPGRDRRHHRDARWRSQLPARRDLVSLRSISAPRSRFP